MLARSKTDDMEGSLQSWDASFTKQTWWWIVKAAVRHELQGIHVLHEYTRREGESFQVSDRDAWTWGAFTAGEVITYYATDATARRLDRSNRIL